MMILLLLLSHEEEEYEEEEEQTYTSSRTLGAENKERKNKSAFRWCVCVFVREYLLRFVWWFDVTLSAVVSDITLILIIL